MSASLTCGVTWSVPTSVSVMKPPVALVAPVDETAVAEVELVDVPFEFEEPEPLTH
jgi:hypothetical protein